MRWFAGIVGGLCPEMEKRAAEFIGSAPFAAEFHNRDAPNGKGKFQALRRFVIKQAVLPEFAHLDTAQTPAPAPAAGGSGEEDREPQWRAWALERMRRCGTLEVH